MQQDSWCLNPPCKVCGVFLWGTPLDIHRAVVVHSGTDQNAGAVEKAILNVGSMNNAFI